MRKRRGSRATIHRRRRFEAGDLVHEHAGHLRRDAIAAAGARALRHGAALPPRDAVGAAAASSYSCVLRGCVRHGTFVRDVRPRPFQAAAKRGAPGLVRRGPVHSGLHWDVDVKNTPVPFSVQGVVYLEDTMAETGALRVVPACRGRLGAIDDSEAVAVEGPAVLWSFVWTSSANVAFSDEG